MAFEIKRGDRRPRYQVQLTHTDRTSTATPKLQIPVNLTDATSVLFIMKDSVSGGAVKVNRAAMTIVDAVNGIVEYPWAAGDTDTAGKFNVEVEVLWGTEPQTFPSKGYFIVDVYEDLG